MFAYLIQLFLIVLVYVFLDNKRIYIRVKDRNVSNDNGTTNSIIGAFVIIIGMQAFRAFTVGTDVKGYLDLFHKVQNVNNVANLEYNRYGYGFAWLTKVISLVSSSDRGFLIISTLLIQIPIAIIIHRFSRNKLMSIYLYICLGFYMATFCTIRQSLTYSLCILSFWGIKEKNLLAFAIPVVCASLLHISAVVFAPAYWIYKVESKRKTLLIYLAALGIAFSFRIQIVTAFLAKFDSYFYYYSIQDTGAYTWTIICISVYIFIAFLKRKQKELPLEKTELVSSGIDGGLLTIFGVGTILSVCSSVATNARRITDYYTIFIILIIPDMYESIQNKKNKNTIHWAIVLFNIAFYIILLAKNGGYGIIPYNFGG